MKLSKQVGQFGFVAAAAFIGALIGLHFLHPRADFPNFSPWMDYAKYTDEGWYGNAAVAYFIRGGWYVPGDFNPAVALPVWPFLEWVLFHFTGVSVSAARLLAVTIFTGNLALTWLLVRTQAPRWTAILAAALVASSSFLYCFSRLAILEPLMILLLLLSWLLALRLPRIDRPGRRTALLAAIGMLICAMVLTKTTGVFLVPSIWFLVWSASRNDRRTFLASSGVVGLAALLPWLTYYVLLVRPRYLADYRYLFTANVYPQPTTAFGWLMAFWYSLHGALWIDPRLAICTVALVLVSLFFFRSLWRNPLFIASLLGGGGYLFFIGFHNNMQPRYYQVVAFPMMIAAVLAFEALWSNRSRLRAPAAIAASLAIGFTLCVNAWQTVSFALHPQYTFVNAARNLTRYIDEHPNRNRLLLSISASNIALVTGLPAICDDFGTLDLTERIRRYQPGWYAAWNELDPGTLEDLHTQFTLEPVANFPAYDDEDRNNLILYRLTPLAPAAPQMRRRSPRLPLGAKPGRQAGLRRVSQQKREEED